MGVNSEIELSASKSFGNQVPNTNYVLGSYSQLGISLQVAMLRRQSHCVALEDM